MTSIQPIVLYPKFASAPRLFPLAKTVLVVLWIANLGLILALGGLASWMAIEIVRSLADSGGAGMPTLIHPAEASADSSADSAAAPEEGEDEEAFSNPLSTPTFADLSSDRAIPNLTGASFSRPPLLQPPQPDSGR